MIPRSKLPELRVFANAEERLPIQVSEEFSRLVVPTGNTARPVHQWFKYKEAFSSELLRSLLYHVELNSKRTLSILDPFCGVGTTLVSAQLLQLPGVSVTATGIECNPFSALVARAKVSWPQLNATRLRSMAKRLLKTEPADRVELPALSSIRTERCISRHMARQVVSMRDAIKRLDATAERDALLVGLASLIEPVSKVRRDGRALRIVEKSRVVFTEELALRWEQIARDVETLQAYNPKAILPRVVLGDGRSAVADPENGNVDLIVTSPPYPNNIDYNEVYKLELWLLGLATSDEEFLGLRRKTFRSHPTCSPLETDNEETTFRKYLDEGPLNDLMGIVVRRVNRIERERARGRSKVLEGYMFDTWRSLRAHHACLREGGYAAYVVGNSLHGGIESPYLVPTDLVFTTIASLVGFEVEKLMIARGLQRRLAGNHFLRDSIVLLRKPPSLVGQESARKSEDA